MTAKIGVEVELKAEAGFWHVDGRGSPRSRLPPPNEFPYFADVDSKNEQEVLQRDFETRRQAKQLMNAGNRSGFDVGQRRVRNIEIWVSLDVGNRPAEPFDVGGFDGCCLSQFTNPFARVHVCDGYASSQEIDYGSEKPNALGIPFPWIRRRLSCKNLSSRAPHQTCRFHEPRHQQAK